MGEPLADPCRCPNCGAAWAPFEDGLACGWRCPACGWAVATTNPRLAGSAPPRFDVWADPGSLPPARAAVAVAAVLGVGIPAARDVLAAGAPVARAVGGLRAEELRAGLAARGVGTRIARAEAGG